MTKTILLTGFEPFGGENSNPSMEIAKALDGFENDQVKIVCAILPVERFAATAQVIDHIGRVKPDMVVALGLAAGRNAITPEKVAINFDDFRIPDNGGNQPVGEPIRNDGPAAYFSTLPVNMMTQTMLEQGSKAAVSFSAGTFVCNHLMYGLLDHIEQRNLPIKAGFVHVPQATELAGDKVEIPTLALSRMTDSIRAGLIAGATATQDLKVNAGNIQ
ncbi:pyroglutamyl-peptidase I [Maritalea sp.]|uniref:pyroglutamyl-peptidase I n=1 Tax=Maritalea sp. TaxID=2003361 RepID=UPI003EF79705